MSISSVFLGLPYTRVVVGFFVRSWGCYCCAGSILGFCRSVTDLPNKQCTNWGYKTGNKQRQSDCPPLWGQYSWEWVNSQLTWSSHLLIRASRAPPAGCLPVTSSWGGKKKKKKRPGTGWIDCVSDTAWRRSVVLQEDTENVAGEWIIPNCCRWVLIPDHYNQGRRRRRKISDSECATRSLSMNLTLSVPVKFAISSTGC